VIATGGRWWSLISVEISGRESNLGSVEIQVHSDHAVSLRPTLIIHYVAAHSYRPGRVARLRWKRLSRIFARREVRTRRIGVAVSSRASSVLIEGIVIGCVTAGASNAQRLYRDSCPRGAETPRPRVSIASYGQDGE
jgi:hypothetical protein